MACGAGMPTVAATVTVLHLLVAVVLSPLTDRLPTRDRNRVLTVRYLDGRGVLRSVLAASSDMGFSSAILATSTVDDAGRPSVAVRARFRGRRPLSDLVLTVSELDGVLGVDASSARPREDPDEDDDA
jgi:putative Mg2+ transporter-C (MgtC) family protein